MKVFWVSVFVLLAITTLGTAEAQRSRIQLEGLEFRVDLIDPEDVSSTVGFSGCADLGLLMPGMGLELGIDFWHKSWDYTDHSDFSWTEIAFLGSARYDFPIDSPLIPFIFGGLNFDIFTASVDPDPGYHGDTSDTELEFGIHMGGGAEYPITDKVNLTGRVGYNFNGGPDYAFLGGGLKFLVGR